MMPTGRAGRLLALGLTLLLLAAIWTAAVQPLLAWHGERAETLAQRVALVRRMADLAATLPELQRQLAGGVAAAPRVATLTGGSDATAGAELQQRVQEMAARAGMTVSSTETLPGGAAGAYRRIGVHLSGSASWPVLTALLRAVAQASPRMLVDDLQVQGPRLVERPAEPPLETAFTVYGFRAAGAGR